MTFLWAEMLWLLLALPVLGLFYLYALRRKRKFSDQYANLTRFSGARVKPGGFRKHVPAIILGLASALLISALARPAAPMTLASQRQTIILAIDVSASMLAQDVSPSRIEAAQATAKSFIAAQPADVRIGIVAFAGTAFLVQAPTIDHDALTAAIDRFQTQRGTALGGGLLVALETIFPDAQFDLQGVGGPLDLRAPQRGAALGEAPTVEMAPAPVPPGSYEAAVVILLTDGRTTTGVDPIDAARAAADRGVRVFTVGVGNPSGGGDTFQGQRMQLDETTLKTIADLTGGEYFLAGSAGELDRVYQGLNAQRIMETKLTEIAFLFAAFGALLILTSAGWSVYRHSRVL